MGAFLVYILKSAVCLAAFYLFYRLLLSRETFWRFNRFLLLNIDIPQSNMIDHEYYKTCIHPYVLQEQWMKKGDIKGLPEGISRFVKYLQTHDCEEMNNVVLIGKLKQSKDEGFTLKDMEFKE